MDKKKAIAAKIKELRKGLKLTQGEFADQITAKGHPITQSAISYIESSGQISMDTLQAICDIYEQPITNFMNVTHKADDAKNGSAVEVLVELTQSLMKRIDKSQDLHEKHITDLEKNNDAHIAANAAFIKGQEAFAETSKIMSKIVDMCLQAGALTVDRSKVVDVLSKLT